MRRFRPRTGLAEGLLPGVTSLSAERVRVSSQHSPCAARHYPATHVQAVSVEDYNASGWAAHWECRPAFVAGGNWQVIFRDTRAEVRNAPRPAVFVAARNKCRRSAFGISGGKAKEGLDGGLAVVVECRHGRGVRDVECQIGGMVH